MTPTLAEEEIIAITGGLRQPARQLEELHRLGFTRARLGRITGRVVLERPHYEAVCRGQVADMLLPADTAPQLKLVRTQSAA